MSLLGPAFYDDDAVFAAYWASRERTDNPNDTLEQPILRELVGDLRGLRIPLFLFLSGRKPDAPPSAQYRMP